MPIADLTPQLEPLANSWAADDIEQELTQMFIDLFQNNLRASERDLNVFGAPQLGSLDLVENYVKRDGLALIRTDEPSMRYLYRAWRARNPKRGLHFLRTYLQLLWPNGWHVDQMWQQKGTPYPTALVARTAIPADDPHTTHYLTSRLNVFIDSDSETGANIASVAPALRAVLAARFVLQIQALRHYENVGDTALGLANGMCGMNFPHFVGDAVL